YNNYETSYTSYAGGGGRGGGFIPGEGSQTTPGGRKDFSSDSLRPVTIKQILEAEPMGDEFNIDGSKVTQITFVGKIMNISTQVTNVTYKLDDGTGGIEAKLWIDADAAEQNPLKARLVEGSYCRVFGKLKSFHDKKHVGAAIIRPVEDYNEVSYHLLEATVVHLYYTRGPLAGATSGGQVTGGAQQPEQTAGGSYGPPNLAQASPTARRVYKYLSESPQTNEGLHANVIAANLGVDMAVVARAGDELLQLGVIYTTVDDLTWAVLEQD
ncbi:replication protein A, subunit RPA32, partial [Westerdykella ornata]